MSCGANSSSGKCLSVTQVEDKERIPEALRFAPSTRCPASIYPSPRVEDAGWIPAGSRFEPATRLDQEVVHGLGRERKEGPTGILFCSVGPGGVRTYWCRFGQAYLSGLSRGTLRGGRLKHCRRRLSAVVVHKILPSLGQRREQSDQDAG
jgi:hypothetical protein